MKTYSIVLSRNWANELGVIIEPYLLPASESLNNLPVIYAESVETNAPFVEAVVTGTDGFKAVIRIPHSAIICMVESADDKAIGFVQNA